MGLCISCPFNCTEQADYAQNLGCLPGSSDIIKIKQETGNNWACHSNNERACQGLKEAGFDITTGKLHLQPGENTDFISWNPEDQKPILK